ncbi:MAG: hypothetical protein HYT22_01380 [Candidatus Niyogibacteria bacterium]|nr:hypothetical protein [Candidatus Niyogibacteria bacterium]
MALENPESEEGKPLKSALDITNKRAREAAAETAEQEHEEAVVQHRQAPPLMEKPPEEKKEEKPETAPEKRAGMVERAKGAWENLKQLSRKHPIWTEALRTTASVAASIAGIRSIYDVPEYFRERFAVRGFRGKGGLDAATEKLLAARWELKKEKPAEKRGEIKHAIADLNRRLKMTKEGVKKGSEQRTKLAEILRENRLGEKQVREERQAKVKEILDNYTTTKVTGMQAAREAMNSAFVATGAFALRPVAYGLMEGAERYHRLAKEARVKGGKVSIVKDVLARGITETFKEAVGRGEQKTKLEKGMSAVRAWGKVARYAGIGATWRPESADEMIGKALDAFSGRLTFEKMGENFVENINRLGDTLKKPFEWGDAEKAEVSAPAATGVAGLEAEISGPPPVVEAMTPEVPIETAVEAGFVGHLEYQGGKSVWNEGEKQLIQRFKEFKTLGGERSYMADALKTYNIDRIKDTIAENPEKYGLLAKDANIVTAEQLKGVHWDQAFEDTFGKSGLTKELTPEQIEGVLRSNLSMKAALAQSVAAHEAAPLMPAAEVAGPLPEQLEYPPPNPDAFVREQELVDIRSVEGESGLTVRDYIVTRRESVVGGMRIEEGVAEAPSGLKQFKVAALWNEKANEWNGEPVEILDPYGKTDALPNAERVATLDTEAQQVIADRNRDFGEAEKNIITARQTAFGTTAEAERATFERLTKDWGIERDRWASEDPLEFWRKNPALDTKTLENIFFVNRMSGNTLDCEVIKKYIDSGFLPKIQETLSLPQAMDLVKILEYPESAKVPVLNVIGEGWRESGLFSDVEWEVKDGNLKISFDVKNNPVDVDLWISRDGTMAVDGHGMRNWHLDKPAPVSDVNLKEAMDFIVRKDGKGAVAIQPASAGRGR